MDLAESIRMYGSEVSNALKAAAEVKGTVLGAVDRVQGANAAQVQHAVAVGVAQGQTGGNVPAAQQWNATGVNKAVAGQPERPAWLALALIAAAVFVGLRAL
jgi:hypothetical protein